VRFVDAINATKVHLRFMRNLLDYIDLFLIHDPLSGSEKRLQTYKALQEARVAGKIRTVGVSN
jgi:diketogulonate reductase-like aldo/keto reductase